MELCTEGGWTDAIASADRLLCTGLYKREITGRPCRSRSLTRYGGFAAPADARRRVQGRGAPRVVDEPSQQWALRAYRLRG